MHPSVSPSERVMPRDGATIFSDLIGKLDMLRVACDKCGRDCRYGLHRLIEKRGRDGKVIDWLGELTADCAKKSARNMNDPCGAKCPQFAEGAVKPMLLVGNHLPIASLLWVFSVQ